MSTLRLFAPEGPLKGNFPLPFSKSVCNRVLIIRAQCKEFFEIENLSDADDTRLLAHWLDAPSAIEDCGAGGTTFRFLLALRTAQGHDGILTGSERLRQRPVRVLVDALRLLGAELHYTAQEGFPPLRVGAKPMQGGQIPIDAGISSQFISAILLVAPSLPKKLELILEGDVVSGPYIDMTVSLMREFGVDVRHKGRRISVASAQYKAHPFTAPPDWSAAAYPYMLAALRPGSRIKLPFANTRSYQGDEVLRDLMVDWGVKTSAEGNDLIIESHGITDRKFSYDLSACPDLAQPFAVLAAASGRHVHLSGLTTLPGKESNRLEALSTELAKAGVEVLTGSDTLTVKTAANTEKISSAVFQAYHDHRMVMSMSLFSVLASEVRLGDFHQVSKSFPRYFDALQRIGFRTEMV